MEYFNALLATVMGDEDQREAALKYLKEVDPEIWSEQLQAQARKRAGSGVSLSLR